MPWQGVYKPHHPEKYVGDVNGIIYRSGLELRLMKHLDSHPDVLNWNSEEIVVPYVSPIDRKMHRYFVDMVARIRTKEGQVKVYLIEVKPESQCSPPAKPRTRKQQARYLAECATYAVNQAKWEAATAYAEKNGWKFIVMTDKVLSYGS